jgi:hypothetical protein
MAAGGSSSEWLKISHHVTETSLTAKVGMLSRETSDFPFVSLPLQVRASGGRDSTEEANMKRLFTTCLLSLWASPNNSIYDMILRSNSWVPDRKAKSLDPGFPREDPIEQPPIRPVRPLPTDVPVPDSTDVPVREPRDVPPPDVSPKPIKPLPTKQNPKSRRTP